MPRPYGRRTKAGQRPPGVLGEQLVRVVEIALGVRGERGLARVAERDERVAAQVARGVARDVEPLVPRWQVVAAGLEPRGERDRRLDVRRQWLAGTAFLDPSVPWADVLAD